MLTRISARRGFSLIELAVVLIIIGIIALIAIPTFLAVIANSRERTAISGGQAIARNAVALAASDESTLGLPNASQVSTAATEAGATATAAGPANCYNLVVPGSYTGDLRVQFSDPNGFVVSAAAC